jgi:hypothetical protein
MAELLFDYPLHKLNVPDDHFRGNADAVFGNTIFAHKHGIRNIRDLYAALIESALLAEGSAFKPVLILEKTEISATRLQSEISRVLSLLQGKLANQLNILTFHRSEGIQMLAGELTDVERDLIPEISRHQIGRRNSRRRRGFSSFDTLRVLAIHWLRATGPLTLKRLGSEVGLTYPSLSKVFSELGSLVEKQSDRSVQLCAFPSDKWPELIINAPKARSSQGYSVPSGSKPRSADALLSRLHELKTMEFAVGGIHAARHYFPGIDLVGNPRLDITLYLTHPMEEMYLKQQLDPTLRKTKVGETPQLVIHHLDRPEPFFTRADDGLPLSDEIDTLLDLHEARLAPQAAELLEHLIANTKP